MCTWGPMAVAHIERKKAMRHFLFSRLLNHSAKGKKTPKMPVAMTVVL